MTRIQKYPIGARLGKGTPPAKVTDGMSNTVLLSEILTWNEVTETGGSVDEGVAQGNDDWRGVWMIPSVGASAFTGKFPPNAKGRGPDFRGTNDLDRGDLIPACGTGIDATNDYAEIPCKEEKESGNIWASARSKHNEGVNAAMGDGSVTFVNDDIDGRVWHAMCTRAGEDVISQ
jgi:prepilin-type processing-associated H-X9-DG protein